MCFLSSCFVWRKWFKLAQWHSVTVALSMHKWLRWVSESTSWRPYFGSACVSKEDWLTPLDHWCWKSGTATVNRPHSCSCDAAYPPWEHSSMSMIASVTTRHTMWVYPTSLADITTQHFLLGPAKMSRCLPLRCLIVQLHCHCCIQD